MAKKELGEYKNKHHSILNNNLFVMLVLIWLAICMVMVLVQILKAMEHPALGELTKCININTSRMAVAKL